MQVDIGKILVPYESYCVFTKCFVYSVPTGDIVTSLDYASFTEMALSEDGLYIFDVETETAKSLDIYFRCENDHRQDASSIMMTTPITMTIDETCRKYATEVHPQNYEWEASFVFYTG